MDPVYRIIVLLVAWCLWASPFLLRKKREAQAPAKIDPRARWGILLAGAGFMIVFAHRPQQWGTALTLPRLFLGLALAAPSIVLVWAAVGNLGKQWRVDAGLNTDHELVTGGAYRIVRHPIYLSMFGMLLAATSLAGTLPGWPFAIVLFALGTEIRVHVEDRLLREHFGDRFSAWQRSVPAWIPFVR